ncbi:restriction endonuclease [Reyranella sp.]|uniref:restriction endonuclease n=1 Tax=Reyranella sp. TaxID=1929291 RepID=UPI0035247858
MSKDLRLLGTPDDGAKSNHAQRRLLDELEAQYRCSDIGALFDASYEICLTRWINFASIRAKYLEAITEQNLAETLSPREFEFLIGALYSSLGYDVHVTQQTRDGGHDIMATKESSRSTERLLIECKCTRSPVRVGVVRQLMGTLDVYNATSGVLVTTSQFTTAAYKFAKDTARLELIDHAELCRRFNSRFGPNWTVRTSQIITGVRADLADTKNGAVGQ